MAAYSIGNDGFTLIESDVAAALPIKASSFPGLFSPVREAQVETGAAKGAAPAAGLLEPVDPTPMGNDPTLTINQPFVTLGGETRVNTTTAGSQFTPKATALANGGYVVVWAGGDNNTDIMGQRYDANGQPAGAEFSIRATPGTSAPSVPGVTALANGGFVVTWGGGVPSLSNEQFVFVRQYNAAGQPLTPNGNLVSTSSLVGVAPQADSAGLTDGSYVVTWSTTSGDGVDIHGQRYNSAGAKLGGEFNINTFTAGSQTESSVAALPGGGFVVIWTSTGQDGSSEGLYGQRYGANGVAAGTEFRVNSSTAGAQYHGEVVALTGGGFLVTWAGQDGGGQLDIFAQRYDASGVAVGAEFRVNTTTAGFQDEPEIGALPDGGFIIAWSSFDGGTSYNVYAQRYNADGTARGGEFLVNSTVTDAQAVSSIAVLQDGQIAIVWQSNAQDGSDWGVYSQRFSGEFLATEQVSKDLKSTVTVGDDLSSNAVTVVLSVNSGLLLLTSGGSGATVTGSGTASVTLTGTVAQINALLGSDATSSFSYFANSDSPPARAVLTVTVTDNEAKATSSTAGIGITATPELATAKNDAATTTEIAIKSGNLFADNGSGADTGSPLTVSAINNNSALVGTTITLASGALLTVQANGNYSYNPNGQFTALGAAGSGASNVSAQDSFTYTLANGNTATVTLTITGVDNNDALQGTPGADTIDGGAGTDTISGYGNNDLLAGGDGGDTINGGDGDDVLFSKTRDAGAFTFISYRAISDDFGTEVDTLIGGAGDDYIVAGYGDNVDGGTQGSFGNRLYISFRGATSGVSADFRLLQSVGSITIGGGVITNIQTVGYLEGSDYDDLLVPIDTYYPTGANVYGRGGNDHIIADYYSGWGSSALYGGDGNDIIDARPAGYGPQTFGDDGDDTIYNGTQFGASYGGNGNDTITGGVTTYGGSGNDTINAQSSYYSPIFYGNQGNDTLNGSDAADTMAGGSGADILFGNDGNDALYSAIADDATGITQGAASAADTGTEHDQLSGGAGADYVSAGYGDDADGGTDTDTLYLSLGGASAGVTLSTGSLVGASPFSLGGGTIQGFEILAGFDATEYDDVITVTTQATALTVNGGGGNDILIATGSATTLNGGNGNDRLVSGSAIDMLNGGAGIDTADFSAAAGNVVLTLDATGAGTTNAGDQVTGIENIIGGFTNDVLTGNASANVINGGGGNDTIVGGGGNDTLNGGAGNDTLAGGEQQDILIAGSGTDTVLGNGGIDGIYMGADLTAGDWIDGGAGNDFLGLQGDYSNYTFGANQLLRIESLLLLSGSITQYSGGDGSARHDYDLTTIDANVAAGQMFVVNGSTLLSDETMRFNGSAETNGSFFFFGGAGGDTLIGGSGVDIFASGAGQDTLTGGGGNDIFYYRFEGESPASARDHITDFTAGDRLHIAAFGLSGVGTSAISFIGSAAFGNVANQLRVSGSGTSWVVELDRDGDGDADFAVTVTTTVSDYGWSANDFAT